jgi:hypothetical protein
MPLISLLEYCEARANFQKTHQVFDIKRFYYKYENEIQLIPSGQQVVFTKLLGNCFRRVIVKTQKMWLISHQSDEMKKQRHETSSPTK